MPTEDSQSPRADHNRAALGTGTRVAKLARRFVAALLLVLASSELTSFIAYRAWSKSWFSYSEVKASRREVAGQSLGASPVREFFKDPLSVHPYAGYAYDFDHPYWKEVGPIADEFGFATGTKGPFHKRSPARLIVAVLGGSVSRQISDEALPKSHGGREVLVLPLGNGGYKQPQQLLILTYLLALGAELDVVINIDGFNEVALPVSESVPAGVFAFYPRNWHLVASTLAEPSTLARAGAVAFARQERKDLAAGLLGSPLEYSVTANLAWALLDKRWAYRTYLAERALQTSPAETRSHLRHGPKREYANDEAMYGDLARVWEESSLQTARLSRQNGFVYVHFLQPNQYDLGSKPLTEHERKYAYSQDQAYRLPVERGYPYLRSAGEELSRSAVHFHDLSRVFEKDGRTLYYDNCCHLNPDGVRTLADEVWRLTVSHLPPEPKP